LHKRQHTFTIIF